MLHIYTSYNDVLLYQGSKEVAVVRGLASHQCGLDSKLSWTRHHKWVDHFVVGSR